MYDVLDIIFYIQNYHSFLLDNGRRSFLITNKGNRIHCTLYLLQTAFLKEYNEPCFKEEIQAWSTGPIIADEYQLILRMGLSGILPSYEKAERIKETDSSLLKILKKAYENNNQKPVFFDDNVTILTRLNNFSEYLEDCKIEIEHRDLIKNILCSTLSYASYTIQEYVQNLQPYLQARNTEKKIITIESMRKDLEEEDSSRLSFI